MAILVQWLFAVLPEDRHKPLLTRRSLLLDQSFDPHHKGVGLDQGHTSRQDRRDETSAEWDGRIQLLPSVAYLLIAVSHLRRPKHGSIHAQQSI